MKNRSTSSAWVLAGFLCSIPILGQTAVPAWQQLFRPASNAAISGTPIAARELADGTILIVTDSFQAVHFDADGNPASARQLAIGASEGRGKGAVPPPRPAASGPDGGFLPMGYGKTFAVIDAFGRVAITLVANADFQNAYSGKIELAKFDGLTGQPLWQGPAYFSEPGVQYPTGLLIDPAGDLIVAGLSRRGGRSQHVTLKYDGQTGALLWGPMSLAGAYSVGAACVGPTGNVLVSVATSAGFDLPDFSTLLYSAANGAVLWGPVAFDGQGAFDTPTVCAADVSGNAYVGGSSGGEFAVLKYDSTGSLVWGPSPYPGQPGEIGSAPSDLILDAAGNLFLAGFYARSGSPLALTTYKLSGSTGASLWGPVVVDNGSANLAPTLALFGNGDVALRGLVKVGSEEHLEVWRERGSDGAAAWGPTDLGAIQPAYLFDYAPSFVASNGRLFGAALFLGSTSSAFELDGSSGALAWGPTPFTIPATLNATFEDLTVGADGNVIATGDDFYTTAWTLKYDGSTGNVLWGPVTLGSENWPNTSFQVLTDAASDVFQVGYSALGTYVVKYSGADGSLLWGPTYFPVWGLQRLALDASGNAVIVGYVSDDQSAYYHASATKVSGTSGAILWGPVTYASSPTQSDFPRTLAVTSAGDVFMVGDSSSKKFGQVWFALKFSGADGALLWSASGPVGQPWAAGAVGGDLVASGSGPDGMTTIKYSGADGSVLWGPLTVPGSPAEGDALAVDVSGNVVVAGTVGNLATANDFATIKYRGTDGTVLWGPVFFDGQAHSSDFVYALGVGLDASGNAVVGGTSTTTARGRQIAVLKYDGLTGATLWGPVFAGGGSDAKLNGFGVQGNLVVAGAAVNGAFFVQAWNESFGIQSLPYDVLPGFCGQPYSFAFTALNGTTPYAWSVVSGSLPEGLQLSSTGILAGVPAEEGSFTFTIRASDSTARTADRTFTLLITEAAEVYGIDASTDASCAVTLSVSGTWNSYLWSPNGETTPTIIVSPLESTTFGVAVTSPEGCFHRFSLTVAATALQNPSCLAPLASGIAPPDGPASGGTSFTISGSNFQPGAVVNIGAVAASGVTVVDATQITGAAPALLAGRAYAVTVVNPDSGNTALPNGWFADFLDVPPSNIFYGDVVIIARGGITTGCGGANYCPDNAVTREQMAVFLLRAQHGPFYAPPPGCIGYFYDVPCSSPYATWIETLYTEGVTAGCGGGAYCPSSPVTRSQMPVFLLKTSNGSNYTPPPATGIFGDVPMTDPFAPWIEQIYAEGITGGCSANPLLYCPASPTTRGQMAVFLVRTFNLN